MKNDMYNSAFNAQLFALPNRTMNDLVKSQKYFLTPDYIKDNNTFLDIGGGGGDLCNAIKHEIANIVPTVFDADINCIEIGRKNFPFIEFIHGYFPNEIKSTSQYDIVCMQFLLPQIADWKSMLLNMRKHAKRYINFSTVVKLSGTTIVDKDISYVYYLDSGMRAHQVIHNLYELINFLSISEMGVKKIEFYGYHTPRGGDNFRCVPNSQQIRGNFMIELFEEDKNPFRVGGAVDIAKNNLKYSFFRPELNIIIDDEQFLDF
jgi:hypothetical protein